MDRKRRASRVTNRLTVREAFMEASSLFKKAEIPEPENNAEILLMHTLNLSKTELILDWQLLFPEEKLTVWESCILRKLTREPVQYITGEQFFYGIPFQVNEHVLIPRPETELLVEAVVQKAEELFQTLSPSLIEVGTGSGAISIAIAKQKPTWNIYASDTSESALRVAKKNAACNLQDSHIDWRIGDLLIPFVEQQIVADIVVANLPYVPLSDQTTLQPEVKLFEPSLALYGGMDGLDLYRKMIPQLTLLPIVPKLVGFEIGLGQVEAVSTMLKEIYQWDEILIIPDLAGISRHIIAIKRD
jgi:release factor glutamine methyltransferase